MTGYKDTRPGAIRFDSHDGYISMVINLVCHDGLYHCPTDVFTLGDHPILPESPTTLSFPTPKVHRVVNLPPPPVLLRSSRFAPTSKARQLESEVWLLRLGSLGVTQLDVLPQITTGLPTTFNYHPFRFIDFKEQARICKQAAQRLAVWAHERQQRFYIDFGFMCASASAYSRQDKAKDLVVFSYDGYSSYILIVNKASRYIWVFLTASKSPPLNIVKEFLTQHGHKDGGCVRTDQGGELARSSAFQDMLLRDFYYTLEPTGANSPSQNGAVEIYNDKFGVCTRTLLYVSGLPAKFWSAALLHSVYLHNRLVHSETKVTPFEQYYGMKPDLAHLKVFGSRVCVKCSSDRSGKLDCNDFTRIFLGFTATDHNILYLDLETGLVKRSHHAQFDEAWYLQPVFPPAAQLLYDLGLEVKPEDDPVEETPTTTVPWPPIATCAPTCDKFQVPPSCTITPLPLLETLATQRPLTAAAAWTLVSQEFPPTPPTIAKTKVRSTSPSNIVAEYLIGTNDMAMVYIFLDPYFKAFEEVMDL